MLRKSLKVAETLNVDIVKHFLNLRVTHKRATIPELEALTFKDPKAALNEIYLLSKVQECVLLQTCNRVEIYAVASNQDIDTTINKIATYWRQRVRFDPKGFSRLLEKSRGSEALLHLLRLASGLESMIIGEDQILGQIQDAFNKAMEWGTVGPIFRNVFESAIRVGKRVRVKTEINRGAVSIGSAAVNLLEENVSDLTGKKIAIIGAGQLGALVGKALAARKAATIFMANRTYERAVWLAKTLGARAVRFDRLEELLTSVDVAVVATAAPHYVLTCELVKKAVKGRERGRLTIIDLSQPRNVEESVAEVPNVELRNIDNLHGIAALNLQKRLKEADKAQMIVQEELARLHQRLKRERAEPLVAAICNRAEEIRCREIEKTLKMMNNVSKLETSPTERCRRCMEIVEDLSKVLAKKILLDPIKSLRSAAIANDTDKILAAQELFNMRLVSRGVE